MTHFNNLGWECPVCHLGNAPFSMTCGHCTRRWEQQQPRPTGEPITCAFCKGLIYPGESHLCKTWERMMQGSGKCVLCGGPTTPGQAHTCQPPGPCNFCGALFSEHLDNCPNRPRMGISSPATVVKSHAYRPEEVFGLKQEPNTVAPPTYDGKFTPPHQVVNTSRVFTVCPACTHEVVVGQPHNCPNTGSPVK